MKRFLEFLNDRIILSLSLLIIYYLLVVLPHKEVSDFFIRLVDGVPRNVYQTAVLLVGLVLLVVYVFFVVRNILVREWKKNIIFYLFSTLLFVVLSFKIIIVHNIEIIHFAQYAGLAILLFPIVKRFGDTIFWATLLGFIDEAYQYLYLKPDGTDYFDFNDVILNLLGAGLGVLLIFSSGFYLLRIHRKKWYRSAVNITLIFLIIAVLILFQTSVISLYPSEDGSYCSFILIKIQETGFWKPVTSLDTRFHVVRPLEGTIIIILLLMFYSTMDRRAGLILSSMKKAKPLP